MGKKNRSKRQPKKRDWTAWYVTAGVVVVLGGIVGFNLYRDAQLPGERFRSLGNAHIGERAATPNYNTNPPTSGPHYPYLAGWGVFDEAPADEALVHNMEDGGVVLWYRSGTPEENELRIRQLEDASRGYRRITIVPRDSLDTTYALTAWQRLDAFDTFDAERVRTFVDAYEGIDHHR